MALLWHIEIFKTIDFIGLWHIGHIEFAKIEKIKKTFLHFYKI